VERNSIFLVRKQETIKRLHSLEIWILGLSSASLPTNRWVRRVLCWWLLGHHWLTKIIIFCGANNAKFGGDLQTISLCFALPLGEWNISAQVFWYILFVCLRLERLPPGMRLKRLPPGMRGFDSTLLASIFFWYSIYCVVFLEQQLIPTEWCRNESQVIHSCSWILHMPCEKQHPNIHNHQETVGDQLNGQNSVL